MPKASLCSLGGVGPNHAHPPHTRSLLTIEESKGPGDFQFHRLWAFLYHPMSTTYVRECVRAFVYTCMVALLSPEVSRWSGPV